MSSPAPGAPTDQGDDRPADGLPPLLLAGAAGALVAGLLAALIGWRLYDRVAQSRALAHLEHELRTGGDPADIDQRARAMRVGLRGPLEQRAARLSACAARIDELTSAAVLSRLKTDLRVGRWRVATQLRGAIQELCDAPGPAAQALRQRLRTHYTRAVAASGAPRRGRDTIAGLLCLLLADLTPGPERRTLRELAAACSPRVGAWAGVERFVDPVDGAVMLLVPAGTLSMGMTDEQARELVARGARGLPREYAQRTLNWFLLATPAHQVPLSAYYIERCEVSNARFARFIAAGGYRDDRLWPEDGRAWRDKPRKTGDPPHRAPAYWGLRDWNRPQLPVVGVSWFEAHAYARWAHKRLPTEAQWERAARGDDTRAWPWGDTWRPGRSAGAEYWAHRLHRAEFPTPRAFDDLVGWSRFRDRFAGWTPQSGPVYLMPVDSMPAGASPYGALHMSGNAVEWCRDYFDDDWYRQPEARARDAAGPPEHFIRDGEKRWILKRAARGGQFNSFRDWARVDLRYTFSPTARAISSGFRCVLPAGPSDP